MEVMIPVSSMDFDFNSARSSPYVSAPSTPKRFGDYYFSAPTSPTRLAEFYSDFNDFCMINDNNDNNSLAIPFSWEETPGTPKSAKAAIKNEDDFAFDFSEDLEKASLPAEELFDNGKIRPFKLKPPPRLQLEEWEKSPLTSPRSPRSPKWQGIREAFSPRKKKDIDPFATAVEKTRKRSIEHERGRERTSAFSSSSSRTAIRSLSPLRVSQYQWEEEKQMQQTTNQSSFNSKPAFSSTTTSASSSSSSSSSAKSSSRKWRLMDFFLFRSASEGRATDKDPCRRYTSFFKKHEDVKNASIRSTDSSGSSVSSSKRRGQVSAHELHYTMNKAASEDLKKKTFLPYKQGILGRLSFNPAVHAVTNGFGSFGRS